MVGYNVQAVVDAKHHLIIEHEVTNVGHPPASYTCQTIKIDLRT
jgi:hypothetical protein